MSVSDYIDLERKRPLSDEDILDMMHDKTNIILYEDLAYAPSLDSILSPYGACVILYQIKPNYGHWCCIFKRTNTLVEFFDPYGMFIDDELKYVHISPCVVKANG